MRFTNATFPSLASQRTTRRAGRAAAEHLIGNGHRTIGIISGPARAEVTRRRLTGGRAACARAGARLIVAHTDYGDKASERAVARLLAIDPSITAIITSDDAAGIGVLNALRVIGRRVPQDVSVLSVGPTHFARLVNPRLTAIDIHMAECSAAAVNYIADTLDGEAPVLPTPAPVTLVSGESVTARLSE